MTVTDGQVATLRAHLACDFAELDEQRQQGAANGDGYQALIAAAMFRAARACFPEADRREVVRFVADMRTRFDPEAIDPAVAERVLMAVVDDASTDKPTDIDDATMVTVQVALLTALIDNARMDDAGLDGFLADARTLADRWLA